MLLAQKRCAATQATPAPVTLSEAKGLNSRPTKAFLGNSNYAGVS